MISLFIREKNNIEENLRKYEEKKAKQQESEVLGQKLIKRKSNKKENTI